MSQFGDFNGENKMRISVSAYTAQIIENDCLAFSQKKGTLLNHIICNYHPDAACSISLRLQEYKEELNQYLRGITNDYERIMNHILDEKAKELSHKYAQYKPADVHWQITLSKKTKFLLTADANTSEENYYGPKPGRYIRALIEEYASKPFHHRESIIFMQTLNIINQAINAGYLLSLETIYGISLTIKPYRVMTDPLTMYHYLVGYNSNSFKIQDPNNTIRIPEVLSLRISRLTNPEIVYYASGELQKKEIKTLEAALKKKGVQFLSSELYSIRVWLSDAGIKLYKSQMHLRPNIAKTDPNDDHVFYFECTDSQIFFYFVSFGEEVKILSPNHIKQRFKLYYKKASEQYENDPPV